MFMSSRLAQALGWWHFSPGLLSRVGEGMCSPPVLALGGPGGEGELCWMGLSVLRSDLLWSQGYPGSYWLLLWMPLP